MQPGMHLDNRVLVEVLEAKLAQAVIREARMEAGIQGLLEQTESMQLTINEMIEAASSDTIVDEEVS